MAALDRNNYLADVGLATALFLAVRLPQPILLEGEAGVGKTEAAKALAELLDTPLYRLQCYEGIDAGEALYEWNHQRQLLGIRLAEVRDAAVTETDLFAPQYLLRRPLLQAIEHPGPRPAVLLLDEIDRADAEFEAFTFELLAEAAVTIPELGTIRATHPPIVILTSNRTRDLHDALTRRCLYHWIDYPGPARIAEIVRRRVPASSGPLALQAAAVITRLRTLDLAKPPGISEAIDWVSALAVLGIERIDATTAEQTLGLHRQEPRRPRTRRLPRGGLARGRHRWVSALTAGAPQDERPVPPTVEAAALSAAFVTALRRAGLSCSPDRAARLAEALRLVPPGDAEQLYWMSRVVLVSAREQLPVFDAVFSAVFRGAFDPASHPARAVSPAAAPAGAPEETRTRPSRGRGPCARLRACSPAPGSRRLPPRDRDAGRGRQRPGARGRAGYGVRRGTPARDVLRRAVRGGSRGDAAAGVPAAARHPDAPEPPHPDVRAQQRAAGRPGHGPCGPALRHRRHPAVVCPAPTRSAASWCCCAMSPVRWNPMRGSSSPCCRAPWPVPAPRPSCSPPG